MGPSTYESLGASEVNSVSKFLVSRASAYINVSKRGLAHYGELEVLLHTTLGRKLGSYFLWSSLRQSILAKKW